MPALHDGDERLEVVDGVERDLRLILQCLERAGQLVLFQELHDDLHHVRGLDLDLRARHRHEGRRGDASAVVRIPDPGIPSSDASPMVRALSFRVGGFTSEDETPPPP